MTSDLRRSIELVNSVGFLLRKRGSLASQTSALIAISGGQDSMCLAGAMTQIQKQWRARIGVVACNHLWQEDSFYSVFHVARVSFLLRQSFCFAPVVCKGVHCNEGEARIWRHNIVQRLASFYQYHGVCTGHTGSDRIETLLFNLMRGSGKRGLSSLCWSRFLTASYPNIWHLSIFDGTAIIQRNRFLSLELPVAEISPRKRDRFRQVAGVCHRDGSFATPSWTTLA